MLVAVVGKQNFMDVENGFRYEFNRVFPQELQLISCSLNKKDLNYKRIIILLILVQRINSG